MKNDNQKTPKRKVLLFLLLFILILICLILGISFLKNHYGIGGNSLQTGTMSGSGSEGNKETDDFEGPKINEDIMENDVTGSGATADGQFDACICVEGNNIYINGDSCQSLDELRDRIESFGLDYKYCFDNEYASSKANREVSDLLDELNVEFEPLF